MQKKQCKSIKGKRNDVLNANQYSLQRGGGRPTATAAMKARDTADATAPVTQQDTANSRPLTFRPRGECSALSPGQGLNGKAAHDSNIASFYPQLAVFILLETLLVLLP